MEKIISKPSTPEYEQSWERIFDNKKDSEPETLHRVALTYEILNEAGERKIIDQYIIADVPSFIANKHYSTDTNAIYERFRKLIANDIWKH